ncbi:hypothetical protein HZS_5312 [Henneguya salminicola]|nr:hypothetical protein HZS_5312 [Henneguya salminicola]
MVFDNAIDLYIPCVFGLVTGKNAYIFCEFLHQIIMILEYILMPKIGTMDFEKSLICATNHEFLESRVIGCYFHFKQTLRRKYAEVSQNSYSVVFRPLIRYGESLLKQFNIYLLNN